MVGGAAIVSDRLPAPMPPRLSVTRTVMVVVVAIVGGPLITPVEEPSDSPPGRVPDVIDQVVEVPLPPEASTVSE